MKKQRGICIIKSICRKSTFSLMQELRHSYSEMLEEISKMSYREDSMLEALD